MSNQEQAPLDAAETDETRVRVRARTRRTTGRATVADPAENGEITGAADPTDDDPQPEVRRRSRARTTTTRDPDPTPDAAPSLPAEARETEDAGPSAAEALGGEDAGPSAPAEALGAEDAGPSDPAEGVAAAVNAPVVRRRSRSRVEPEGVAEVLPAAEDGDEGAPRAARSTTRRRVRGAASDDEATSTGRTPDAQDEGEPAGPHGRAAGADDAADVLEAEAVVEEVEVPGAVAEQGLDVEAEAEEAENSGAPVRRRRRRRAVAADAVTEEVEPPAVDTPVDRDDDEDDEDDEADEADEAEEAQEDGETAAEDAQRPAARRRRRRGGRGRGRRTRETTTAAADLDVDDAEPADTTADDETTATATDPAPPTRLSARTARGRSGIARSSQRPRTGQRGGRRPTHGVSEETRRAIADGPPKKMLVTVGKQRTQIAVLEERNLVEHYVTRREDVSYVGNIYLGRVQNVLPGMEAAFVDIGKGRNGVLYAGEVNYDEADLEGDLPRIEQTLRPGQTVLVQVTKDPMGTKGARLTQQLSIAGRYCVLAPGDGMLGISRKLPDEERERLRKIVKAVRPEQYGLIVRTAAEGATREQLEDDIARLVRIWEQVEARAAEAKPLEPVYEEPDLVIRVIRDVFGPEFSDLIVDDAVLAEQVRTYLGDVSPELVDRAAVASGEEHLFDGYEVTNQIRRALEKKVWLASGGYLIVEKTEAMWVIDVNTGKFVGKSNLEETVLRNNLEAAEEIARQLRLRDMGGIIVIDFVDMLVPANRDEVLKRFKRELARDKTKSRVMEISRLGLVQMTRKNVSQGLTESFTKVCDCCDGRGAQIVESMLG